MPIRQVTRPPIEYHGSKWRCASWVIQHFPQHDTYVEPFGGAAGVLLKKLPASVEVYNDLDAHIVNLFRVLRDNAKSEELCRRLELTPFSRKEFEEAVPYSGDDINRAWQFIIRSDMGFGSDAHREDKNGGFRCYSGSVMNANHANKFRTRPAHLPAITRRLRNAFIESCDAMELIERFDSPTTLFYIDPPYVRSTRTALKSATQKIYAVEIDDVYHKKLAKLLHGIEGMVILSGYDCELYRKLYEDWKTDSIKVKADGGTANPSLVRTEWLWTNPACFKHSGWLL
jgi:DNA adenine methylase